MQLEVSQQSIQKKKRKTHIWKGLYSQFSHPKGNDFVDTVRSCEASKNYKDILSGGRLGATVFIHAWEKYLQIFLQNKNLKPGALFRVERIGINIKTLLIE